jgi:hypothetical protein
VIILFPAINIVFSLPLVAIMVSDNLIKQTGILPNTRNTVTIRVFVWLVPTILAFFAHDLAGFVSWAGIVTILLNLMFGSAMYIVSERKLPGPTRYSGFWSNLGIAKVNVVISGFFFVIAIMHHF